MAASAPRTTAQNLAGNFSRASPLPSITSCGEMCGFMGNLGSSPGRHQSRVMGLTGLRRAGLAMGLRLDVGQCSRIGRRYRSLPSAPLCREPAQCAGGALFGSHRNDTAPDRPMEIMGYTLPEHMLPDISHGKMFCKWLRDVHGIDTDALPTYLQVFEDGRRVWPRAYPEELLAAFRRHFREEWLPNRAIEYFRGRDSEALQFLPKLIAANKPQRLN